jgi:hypothetical protein
MKALVLRVAVLTTLLPVGILVGCAGGRYGQAREDNDVVHFAYESGDEFERELQSLPSGGSALAPLAIKILVPRDSPDAVRDKLDSIMVSKGYCTSFRVPDAMEDIANAYVYVFLASPVVEVLRSYPAASGRAATQLWVQHIPFELDVGNFLGLSVPQRAEQAARKALGK